MKRFILSVLLALLVAPTYPFASETQLSTPESLTIYNKLVEDEKIKITCLNIPCKVMRVQIKKTLEYGTIKGLDFTVSFDALLNMKVPMRDYGGGKSYLKSSLYPLTQTVSEEFYDLISDATAVDAILTSIVSPFIVLTALVVDTFILTPGTLIANAVNGAENQDYRSESLGAVSYTHLTLPTTPYV